jgi:hypothetical protein
VTDQYSDARERFLVKEVIRKTPQIGAPNVRVMSRKVESLRIFCGLGYARQEFFVERITQCASACLIIISSGTSDIAWHLRMEIDPHAAILPGDRDFKLIQAQADGGISLHLCITPLGYSNLVLFILFRPRGQGVQQMCRE